MKFMFIVLLLSLSLYRCKETENTEPVGTKRPYVILISFDGFRHDYLEKAKTPHLDHLIANGIKAHSLIPTFPSKTFPNHYSIVTGMHAGVHGLVDNKFYDESFKETYSMGDRSKVTDAKWYGGEAIWTTAKKNNIRSGSVFWVGSEITNEAIKPHDALPFNDHMNNESRVDKLIEWLNRPKETRPQLLTLYYSDIDHAGHNHGTNSEEVVHSVEAMDTQIGYLRSKIETLPFAEEVHIVIVSDHGMTNLSEERRVSWNLIADVVKAEGLKPWDGGTMLKVFSSDDNALERIYNKLKAMENHFTVFNRDELKTKFSYYYPTRTPDLAVVPENGYYITDQTIGGGTHGFLPTASDMHGIFIAYGKQFKTGLNIDSFENVHIYPILTELLGITYSHKINGDKRIADNILKRGN